MQKQEFLGWVTKLSKENLFSKSELLDAYNKGVGKENNNIKTLFPKIISLVGGLIIYTGYGLFLGLIWGDITLVFQILLTLGFGLILFITANFLTLLLNKSFIGISLHIPAAPLILVGIILLIEAVLTFNNPNIEWYFIIVLLALGLIYLVTDFYTKNSVLSVLTSFFLSMSYLGFSVEILRLLPDDWYNWSTMMSLFILFYGSVLTSISFLLIKLRPVASSIFSFFGYLTILSSTFYLLYDNLLLELLYIFVLSFGIYGGFYLKSKMLFFVTIAYIIFYIFYITSRYFADSLSWPLILILLGMILIGLGFFAYKANKEYFNTDIK